MLVLLVPNNSTISVSPDSREYAFSFRANEPSLLRILWNLLIMPVIPMRFVRVRAISIGPFVAFGSVVENR